MTRSTKVWFGVSAFALMIAALLAIVALAVSVRPHWAEALPIAISMGAAFFCVFVGIAEDRRQKGGRQRVNMSIEDELESRKLRARGARVEFR